MSRIILAAVAALTFSTSATDAKMVGHVYCGKTPVRAYSTYAKKVYRRTTVSSAARKHLATLGECASAGRKIVKRIHDREINARRERQRLASFTYSTEGASWYDDSGATASGNHYPLGVAHKALPFGTRVRMCYRGCATVIVEDRGPFIAGRSWDLNPGAKAAIGFGDVGNVRVHVLG
jgi:rare lipoprotein A (peptidoglycan hydrolase)